jgi:hypothetical protein
LEAKAMTKHFPQIIDFSLAGIFLALASQACLAGDRLKEGDAMITGELMDLESRYLDALSRVTGFSFLAGKLVLNWEKDGNWSAMMFTPR